MKAKVLCDGEEVEGWRIWRVEGGGWKVEGGGWRVVVVLTFQLGSS